MTNLSHPRTPSELLLDQLQALGMQKGAIAKRLDIQPSAVSDLYAGRRQLKYDEGMTLAAMLPYDAKGRRLPIIPLSKAGEWETTIEDQDMLQMPFPSVVTSSGAFAVKLPGGLIKPPVIADEEVKNTRAYAIVDPGQRHLFADRLYLVDRGDRRFSVLWYCADPARFEPAIPSAYEKPLSIGSDEFRVIGGVTAILHGF